MPHRPASQAGEHSRDNGVTRLEGIRKSFDRLQVILPDVTNVGGIAAWKRIAQTAESHGAWCVPHAFSTGIVSAASLHLLANTPREHMIEWSMEGSPLNTELTAPRLLMAYA